MAKIVPFCDVTAEYILTDTQGVRLAASTPETLLRYVHGTGQLLSGLEAALEGCRAGDTLKVMLKPDEAYGPYRPELVFEAVQENLPPKQEIRVGMMLIPGGQQGKFSLKVMALTERGAMLDGNHPLAGKTITWALRILKVQPGRRPSQEEELDHQPIRWVEVE